MDVKELASQLRDAMTPELTAIREETQARQAELEKRLGEVAGKVVGFGETVEELRKLNSETKAQLEQKAEAKRKAKATNRFAPQAASADGEEPKGMQAVARVAAAHAWARLHGKGTSKVPSILRDVFRSPKLAEAVEQRALVSNSATAGGVLVPTPTSSQFADFLNATSVVRSAGPVTIPMPEGSIEIPRGVSSATATYQEEAVNATATDPAFGRILLSAKKVTAQTAVSNDLIRRSPLAVESIVAQNLLLRVALREDLAFLMGDGTSSTPKGLRHLAVAGNVQATAGTTLDQQTTDARRRMNNLVANNIMLTRACWFWHPRTRLGLQTLRDGVGNFQYADEISAGRFLGLPWKETTQIPINQGGGTESVVILAAMDYVVIGDSLNLEVEAVRNGAYVEGGAVRSGLSRDETVIVVRHESDINVYHPEAVAVTTGVTLGA